MSSLSLSWDLDYLKPNCRTGGLDSEDVLDKFLLTELNMIHYPRGLIEAFTKLSARPIISATFPSLLLRVLPYSLHTNACNSNRYP